MPSLYHLFISISSPEIQIQIKGGMTGPHAASICEAPSWTHTEVICLIHTNIKRFLEQ